MSQRPYVLLSVAVSLDGCVDDTGTNRLLLSNDQDFDRVDEVRSGMDAILVGANTIRSDNPRLLVNSAERKRQRVGDGLPATPVKVTLTSSGNVEPTAKFFTTGDNDKLVYTTSSAFPSVQERLGEVATVVDAGDPLDVHAVLADLTERKIERLMVEGGGMVHTLFLSAGVVDELHVVYAPFFVGQADAPRLVNPAVFPQGPGQRMKLAEVRQLGDVVLLRYHPQP
ncbi:RibD family protein [Amycolatopsis sp.]|jgi:5-amino-6-(5-phosphoribosylamino)uracil reductase|uniref:RibD family protein n=1 Tax=Amycolatopsis sp. TaxID=37632 RepID=UPI002E0B1A4C|nr:dihydrofolate reductase family protein [Amycolatopsis sp.]